MHYKSLSNDCQYKCDFVCFLNLLSGLIDGHTHPVWVGDRVHEFAMKVKKAEGIFFHFYLLIFLLSHPQAQIGF